MDMLVGSGCIVVIPSCGVVKSLVRRCTWTKNLHESRKSERAGRCAVTIRVRMCMRAFVVSDPRRWLSRVVAVGEGRRVRPSWPQNRRKFSVCADSGVVLEGLHPSRISRWCLPRVAALLLAHRLVVRPSVPRRDVFRPTDIRESTGRGIDSMSAWAIASA